MKSIMSGILGGILVVLLAIGSYWAIDNYTSWLDKAKPGKVQVITDSSADAPQIPLGEPLGAQDAPVMMIDLGLKDAKRDLHALPVVGVCPHLTPAGEIVVGVAAEDEDHLGLSCINTTVNEPLVPATPPAPAEEPAAPAPGEGVEAPPAPADANIPPAPVAPEPAPAPVEPPAFVPGE